MQSRGRHAQGLANPILAATGRSAQHFASAGFIIRTQAEQGTKVVSSIEAAQIIAELGHQGNPGENADAGDSGKINAKEASDFFPPRPLGFILTSLLAPRFARPSDGLRAGYFRAQPHDLDRLGDSGEGFKVAAVLPGTFAEPVKLVVCVRRTCPRASDNQKSCAC